MSGSGTFPTTTVLIVGSDAPARARTMAANSSACRLAPPTRRPSTSGWAIKPAAVDDFTEPPYWMRVRAAKSLPSKSARRKRISACTSWACSGVATRPVPIAHTGS